MARLAIARLPYSNNLLLAQIVERGIRASAVMDLAKALGLSRHEFADAVSIPRRTMDRRVAHNAWMRMNESDRVVRLGRIYTNAAAVFGDADEAARWLREPCDALDGRTPLEISRTDPGARAADEVLGRIEHGVI